MTAVVSVLFVLERTHFQFTMEHFEVMFVGKFLHTRKGEGWGDGCLCMKRLTTDNSLILAMTFVAWPLTSKKMNINLGVSVYLSYTWCCWLLRE